MAGYPIVPPTSRVRRSPTGCPVGVQFLPVQNCAILCERNAAVPHDHEVTRAFSPRKRPFQRGKSGGRGGIRTHGEFHPTLDFGSFAPVTNTRSIALEKRLAR